jgi:hypothetical protein
VNFAPRISIFRHQSRLKSLKLPEALPLHATCPYTLRLRSGLKISFTWPSDKMSDDCEFGSDICMMTDENKTRINISTMY